MRKITIEINGSRKDVSDVFIRELFQRGIISPHTRIWRNGVEMPLSDAPDLMAPPPTYSASRADDSGISGVSSSGFQPSLPPLSQMSEFGGADAYNRTYVPEVGATSKQSNRFMIFLWITLTLIALLLVGAFIVYQIQNRQVEDRRPADAATQEAEEAFEQTEDDLGDLSEDEFGELLEPGAASQDATDEGTNANEATGAKPAEVRADKNAPEDDIFEPGEDDETL